MEFFFPQKNLPLPFRKLIQRKFFNRLPSPAHCLMQPTTKRIQHRHKLQNINNRRLLQPTKKLKQTAAAKRRRQWQQQLPQHLPSAFLLPLPPPLLQLLLPRLPWRRRNTRVIVSCCFVRPLF